MYASVYSLLFLLLFSLLSPACAEDLPSLVSVVDGPQRSASRKARDVYRHPVETLRFFEIRPELTVVEIWPGGGWYTDILAPYLKARGQYIAAHFDPLTDKRMYIGALERFQSRYENDPETWGKIRITAFDPPHELEIAPPGSADRVLTFRNLHNWYMRGPAVLDQAAQAFYRALKPGGILGVVEHRLRPGDDLKPGQVAKGGYMDEAYVIQVFEKAGFRLAGKSEINANPKDSTRHPKGVWTLPPTLRLKEKDREKYLNIGESDRMTLKFIKPE